MKYVTMIEFIALFTFSHGSIFAWQQPNQQEGCVPLMWKVAP